MTTTRWAIWVIRALRGIPDARRHQLHNCSNVTLNGVTIAHTQQWALEFIGTAAAGQGNALTNSVLYDLGTGGIRIGQITSQTDTDATVAQNNNVSNDMVANGGRFLPGAEGTGIWIGSAHDNSVSHLTVHDFYNGAIEVGQQPQGGTTYTHDNTIEFNQLYDLGQGVTNDTGCFHIVSSNNAGNKILNNVCHDVTHDPGPGSYGDNGIYVDSNVENVTIENKLAYRVSDTATTTVPGTPTSPSPTTSSPLPARGSSAGTSGSSPAPLPPSTTSHLRSRPDSEPRGLVLPRRLRQRLAHGLQRLLERDRGSGKVRAHQPEPPRPGDATVHPGRVAGRHRRGSALAERESGADESHLSR